MLKWYRTGRTVTSTGESTTVYKSDGGHTIESRKRNMPHAARGGFWQLTTYWLILPDGSEKQFHRLQDAKKAAEA